MPERNPGLELANAFGVYSDALFMNQELSPNTTLSHYRIVSKIGAGGMGEVYLAQDTRLDRRVAIKFLHQEFSKDADKLGRFIQEAKAGSERSRPSATSRFFPKMAAHVGFCQLTINGQGSFSFQARNGRLAEIRWQIQFEPLRGDPRFKDLIKRMGLPQ